MSNLRQILVAATNYIQENKGNWPPAHLDYLMRNRNRWHGTRATLTSPFDFNGSVLRRYLQTPAIKQCAAFEPTRAGFEAACGGYGYNNRFIGGSSDVPPYSTMTLGPPARVSIPVLACRTGECFVMRDRYGRPPSSGELSCGQ